MKPLKLVLTPTRNRRLNELIGLLMLVAAVLLLLSLVSYRPTDPSFDSVGGYAFGRPAHNWTGLVGATLSDLLLQSEGAAAFAIPLLMAVIGLTWMRSRPAGSPLAKTVGVLLCLLFVPALFGLIPGHLQWMYGLPVEGLTGRLMADALLHYLNFPGACIVAASMVAIALYLSTTFSFNTAREWITIRFAFVLAWRDRLARWRSERARRREFKAAEKHARLQARAEAKTEAKMGVRAAAGNPLSLFSRRAAPVEPSTPDRLPEGHTSLPSEKSRPAKEEEELPTTRRGGFFEVYAAPGAGEPEPAPSLWEQMPRATVGDLEIQLDDESEQKPAQKPELKPQLVRVPRVPESPAPTQRPEFASQGGSISVGERADASIKSVTLAPKSVSGYRLPPSTLLTRHEEPLAVREDELRVEAQVLVEKCAEFDVRGQVVQINPGPVVTTFEFRPEAGVKYSRVTGLAEDLCLAMRAESILIERMAGKSTVGIQVPNHNRETIWLRDVIESENFLHPKSKLTLAMGKDINGRIVTADLAAMPHVLIAGSTGSGKSVAINAMIMSVLYKATPEQVRLILVDPKRVELGMYEGIPHLFTPIITEAKLAANALRNAVREMERRLKLLASRSVRNIDQYNRLFEAGTPSLFEDTDDQEPLPYIIIIIDELADLMMLDKSNVEESITRLAQMARAVGIHLVLATQRPSVDVITGLIKANVPTRISFRLATKVDSRTILDSNGAEALLGRGDLLFLPPGTSRVQRLHAPFVTEKEITAVVDFWKTQGQAEYVQGFLESPRDEKGRELDENPDGGEGNDELYEDGVRLVLEFGKASTSLLQRRLRIGYGRAAHLIDMMERDGIVGSADGSKPREILKPPGWLSEVESTLR
ncbi:MAG TPA: DNA translocase FtsK [Acidisarcina sp.]